ncbi:hypothetical protein [Streptomyces sp. NPDC057284]|uniref:hypothetical protein n=1 Tax=Streptomyces sp. NPDC057284 TaxID=3346083 RepID=UPI003630A0CB
MATAAVATVALQQSSARADMVPPEHAIIVCQSASFYANYNSASAPTGFVRTLSYGDKVGHTRGPPGLQRLGGPNDWGYVRYECIGGYGSW